jgi:hypothetical protein
VPLTIKPLPPDDPIFSLGVSFVFRSDLPQADDEHESDDVDDEDVED